MIRRAPHYVMNSVNLGLAILLCATLGGALQGYRINRRADRIAITVVDLGVAVRNLSATLDTLDERVVDCLDPGGTCKRAADANTAAAVNSIVQTLHDDVDATLAQLQADLERLRLGQPVVVTPLPPVVTVPPTPPPPAPTPPTICLPLGVVTVGCTP